jgi:hypothetical protein
MVAIELLFDVHSTEEVRSCVLPSVKVPVAANCWLPPFGTVGFTGVIVRRASAAGVTFKVALPEIKPDHALIVVVPTAALRASPLLPIAATTGAEEDQDTDVVIIFVLPFV